MPAYRPKTGAACGCKRGAQRDNCPTCEGTGLVINFAAIRARNPVRWMIEGTGADAGLFWSNADGWGDRESADVFTEQEAAQLRLPIGGVWRSMTTHNPELSP